MDHRLTGTFGLAFLFVLFSVSAHGRTLYVLPFGDNDGEGDCEECGIGENLPGGRGAISRATESANQMLLRAYSDKITRFREIMNLFREGSGQDVHLNLGISVALPQEFESPPDINWIATGDKKSKEKAFLTYIDSTLKDIEKHKAHAGSNEDRSRWALLRGHLYGIKYLQTRSKMGEGKDAFKAVEEAAELDPKNEEAWRLYGSRVTDLKPIGGLDGLGIRVGLGGMGDKKKKIIQVLENKTLHPTLTPETSAMLEKLKKV